jgi:hypothetical protein
VIGAKQVGAAVNQHQFFLFLLIHTDALKCPIPEPDHITATATTRSL